MGLATASALSLRLACTTRSMEKMKSVSRLKRKRASTLRAGGGEAGSEAESEGHPRLLVARRDEARSASFTRAVPCLPETGMKATSRGVMMAT